MIGSVTTMNLSSFLSILQTIVVLVIVIFLANISLKYANKYMQKNNKIIKIVERISVNNNSSLSIVDICGKYYLMSFTGNDNKILKELDKEEIESFLSEMENRQDLLKLQGRLGNLFEMRKKID